MLPGATDQSKEADSTVARLFAVLGLVPRPGEIHEVAGRHGIAGRFGAVGDLFGPREQRFVIVRGEEKPAPLRVGEQSVLLFLQLVGRREPPLVLRAAMQRQQSVDDEGVIIEIGPQPRLPLA